MDDIAKRTGIAKGSLYLYFKDKDSVYSGLVQSLFDKLFPLLSQTLRSPMEPIALLHEVLKTQVTFFEHHIDVFTHFFREGPGCGGRENSLKNAFREYVRQLTEIIKEGIRRKQFRNVNPNKSALILVGMIRSAIVERIHGFSEEPLSADIEKIWDIYLHGVGQ